MMIKEALGTLRRWLSGETHDRIVLELLAQALSPMRGLDIVELSRGRISRGAVYVILSRLKDRGLVESKEESVYVLPGVRRLVYRITDDGRTFLVTRERGMLCRDSQDSSSMN